MGRSRSKLRTNITVVKKKRESDSLINSFNKYFLISIIKSGTVCQILFQGI